MTSLVPQSLRVGSHARARTGWARSRLGQTHSSRSSLHSARGKQHGRTDRRSCPGLRGHSKLGYASVPAENRRPLTPELIFANVPGTKFVSAHINHFTTLKRTPSAAEDNPGDSQAVWPKVYERVQESEIMQNCELQYTGLPTMLERNGCLRNYRNWHHSHAQTRSE